MSPTACNPSVRSYTRRFEVDVFVSYGHIDNQENWVTHFHACLQTRLQELLGTSDVAVWRDPKLEGMDMFEDLLREKLARSALFISILSPRYSQSASCRKEVDWFMEGAQRTGGLRLETKSRLIKVTKTRLMEEMEPPGFQGTLGYKFYKTDPENPDMFHEFSSQSDRPRFNEFRELCDNLAQAVARMLRRLREFDPVIAPTGKTVFLARTTSDLEPRRTAIRSELTDRGHTVASLESWPDSGPQVREALEPLLANCELSVHLFGRMYGMIPEEETRSFGELQYELALAQRQRSNFHQLMWIPESLENAEERQQAFLNKLRQSRDQVGSNQYDLLETDFESFKESLLDRLSPKSQASLSAPRTKSKSVYLLCNQLDLRRDPLEKIKAYLRSRGHPVELPPFEGDPIELRNEEDEIIGETGAALIYYGTAKDAWVVAKRRMLRKALSAKDTGQHYARALYLCSPRDDKKDDYLSVPDHLYLEPEPQGFPPLLVVGDCGEFEPAKLDSFIDLIESQSL